MVLVRVISSARCQQAVLMSQAQDPAPPAPPLPDTRIEVGDKMFGGTLVLVHPKGAVTELNGALRFHHIGAQLQQFQPLTEQEQPEVYHEFKKLEARSAGISAGPG